VNTPANYPLETILADCLDAVLSGQASVADCLERFPEVAGELKPLLLAGILAARLRSPEMAADQVDALEARLRAQMAARTSGSRQVIILPVLQIAVGRAAAIIVIAFMVFFGGSAGLVGASANTVPGDTLYTLKRFWENLILVITTLAGSLDELWLHFAQVRLEEAVTLSQQNHLTPVALADLYTATVNAALAANPENQGRVIAFMDRAREALAPLAYPPEVADVFQDTLTLMNPVLDSESRLQTPDSLLPPHYPAGLPGTTPTPVIADTAPATPTPTLIVATATPTATLTASATLTPSATATWTPRFPATATTTPTWTPSPTWTLTATLTPSPTWTPLPLPQVPPIGTPVLPPTAGHTAPRPTDTPVPTLDITERVRETQRSVYLTQTAGPQETPGS
jgi:hypothetical protein